MKHDNVVTANTAYNGICDFIELAVHDNRDQVMLQLAQKLGYEYCRQLAMLSETLYNVSNALAIANERKQDNICKRKRLARIHHAKRFCGLQREYRRRATGNKYVRCHVCSTLWHALYIRAQALAFDSETNNDQVEAHYYRMIDMEHRYYY